MQNTLNVSDAGVEDSHHSDEDRVVCVLNDMAAELFLTMSSNSRVSDPDGNKLNAFVMEHTS